MENDYINFKYPKWISEPLKSFLKLFVEKGFDKENELPEWLYKINLLYKSIHSLELKEIWEGVDSDKTVSSELDHAIENNQIWLSLAICGSIPTERLEFERAKTKKWEKDVLKHIDALCELLRKAPVSHSCISTDISLQHINELSNDSFMNDLSSESGRFFKEPMSRLEPIKNEIAKYIYMSGISSPILNLEMLKSELYNTDHLSFWKSTRLTRLEGSKLYFARSLKHAFLSRRLEHLSTDILLILNVIFDSSMTVRQLNNHCKDIVEKPEKFNDCAQRGHILRSMYFNESKKDSFSNKSSFH